MSYPLHSKMVKAYFIVRFSNFSVVLVPAGYALFAVIFPEPGAIGIQQTIR